MATRLMMCFLCLSSVLGNAGMAQSSEITLKQALQIAKRQNLSLQISRYDQAAAAADITTARLRPNPVLNNQTLQMTSNTNFAPDTRWLNGRNRQVWWQLTKQFVWADQRRAKIAAAESNMRVAAQAYPETERNLLGEVAMQWLEAWASKQKLNILIFAKQNIDSLLIINQLRYNKEVITQTDLMRTRLLATQYELQLPPLRQQYRNALNALRQQLNNTDTLDINEEDNLNNYALGIMKDSLIAQTLENRADVQLASAIIEANKSNKTLQRLLARPVPELGLIWNPQNTVPYLGFFGTIQLPVFSRNQGERQKSQVLLEQSEQNLVYVQTQARTEAYNAYNAYVVNVENLKQYDVMLQQSQEILDKVRYAYLRGGTTIVDYLESQRAWLETRQQYLEAVYQSHKALIELLIATGRIGVLAQ